MPVIAGLMRVDPPCRRNPDLFFSESPARVEQAKAICARCPWLRACRLTSLEWDEPYGTWGGLTPDERQQLAGRRHTQPDNHHTRGAA